MLLSKFDFLLDLLHQIEDFFFVARIGDHLNAYRKSFRSFHRLIALSIQLIFVIIIEVLLVSCDSSNWQDSCRIVENAPDHGKGRAETKLLINICITLACPSLKAGIKKPGQIIRSISLLLRY